MYINQEYRLHVTFPVSFIIPSSPLCQVLFLVIAEQDSSILDDHEPGKEIEKKRLKLVACRWLSATIGRLQNVNEFACGAIVLVVHVGGGSLA